jgi:hypothetical protein
MQSSEIRNEVYKVVTPVHGKKAVFIQGLGVISDFMASDDLNECVEALLEKRSKAAFKQHADAI